MIDDPIKFITELMQSYPPQKYLHALDLSMKRTGIAIFDIETFDCVYIASKETDDKKTHGERLYDISTWLDTLRIMYRVAEVAIERGFSRFNTSTQVIYRVHGVANMIYREKEQKYYPPKSVKKAIWKGNATKAQIQKILKEKYPNVEFMNEDESDAFSVGIAHLIERYKMPFDKPKAIKKSKKIKKEG